MSSRPHTAPAVTPFPHRGAWLFFNLLSLDAPSVAVAWQLLFAKSMHIPVTPAAVLALAVAVWLIYAADRLLDVFRAPVPLPTRRHQFHRAHGQTLLLASVAALCLLFALCPFLRPAVIGYGAALSGIVALYFCVIHLLPVAAQQWCPKELAVGIVFAIGTCLAPWTRLANPLQFVAPACLFAALCCLNCVAIEAWEWHRYGARSSSRPHAVTLWLSQRLRPLFTFIALMATLLFFTVGAHLLFAAIGLSSLAFLWLEKEQHRIPADLLRVLADLPLLSPLLLIGLR
ncbi:MAG: hypothetical protein M3Y57_00700 [Acidobacteriota bacterium]|nr:hypothetical protein [Acidobacteriota bacterium]